MTATESLPVTQHKPRRLWRRVLLALGIFVAFVLVLLRYMGVFGGNIRTVSEGRVYRSAHITGALLENLLQEKGIRTMLNLRGGSLNDWWYRSEVESCRKLHVRHIDAAFSAVKFPPPQVLMTILGVLDNTTYPLLFHCRGGSDRSGLVGTLYLHLYENVPLEEALQRQLTWRYGHIRFGQAHAMDDFFEMYRQNSDGLGLRDWIIKKYPSLYAALPASKKVKETLAPTPPQTDPVLRHR